MKVIFLDRDGVINKYPGDRRYVTTAADFKFIPGSVEGIRKFNGSGFKIFVVSNQAGIGKGIYSRKELDNITGKMQHALKKQKCFVDGVYYCTHLPEDDCSCRKPKPGLLQQAVSDSNLQKDSSFFIGDSFRDMQAAREFGVKSVLVFSGREKISNRSNWEFEPDYIFDNLLTAANYICSRYG